MLTVITDCDHFAGDKVGSPSFYSASISFIWFDPKLTYLSSEPPSANFRLIIPFLLTIEPGQASYLYFRGQILIKASILQWNIIVFTCKRKSILSLRLIEDLIFEYYKKDFTRPLKFSRVSIKCHQLHLYLCSLQSKYWKDKYKGFNKTFN